MLDSLHQLLYNARLIVCFVTVPVGLYSAWRCYNAIIGADATAAAVRPTRRMPSRPPDAPPGKPVQQQLNTDKPADLPSVEAGKESRLHKALASTIRIDTGDARHTTSSDVGVATKPNQDTTPTVADEVNQLFAGLDDKLQPNAEAKPKATPQERSAEALARAGRLEQLGFHRPSQPDGGGARVTSNPSKPAEAANGPELDDILAKLDKVLGEKPATKVTEISEAPAAPPVSAAPAAPATAKAPLWARADATDEDADAKPDPGKQLGVFDDGKDTPKT